MKSERARRKERSRGRLCLPKAFKHWSLRSVQVMLIKMGGRLVQHSRRLIFQVSEVSVPRRLFEGE
ncbi:MAG: hypothetical protein OXD46_07890, partial [Chloroflexi bacterium]|nr:hypothetical protein [Chloroflexota bacterium]